jgi:hypothetical protein
MRTLLILCLFASTTFSQERGWFIVPSQRLAQTLDSLTFNTALTDTVIRDDGKVVVDPKIDPLKPKGKGDIINVDNPTPILRLAGGYAIAGEKKLDGTILYAVMVYTSKARLAKLDADTTIFSFQKPQKEKVDLTAELDAKAKTDGKAVDPKTLAIITKAGAIEAAKQTQVQSFWTRVGVKGTIVKPRTWEEAQSEALKMMGMKPSDLDGTEVSRRD